MSRCFLFPPPGYEKKPTTDDPDLLKKEKHKEKKRKKDKKDKEKKDGKEKKEKDRSEGKHKEKKDKKDKHRDKKKDKERSKSSTPDEKKIYGQFEGRNGEKLQFNNEDNKDKTSSSSDQKQSLQFLNGNDKRSPIQYPCQNGELVPNRTRHVDPENHKFVQELDRRIKDEEKGMGSHQFGGEGRKIGVNNAEIQKMGGRQSMVNGVPGFGGNPTVQNKINGSTPPLLDNIRIEQKKKMQDKETDGKRGDKRKHKDRDKQREGKDKDTAKQKKDEKSKEKNEKKKAERDKNKHIKKSDSVAVPSSLSAHPLENGFQGVGSEANSKKRKDMATNGVFHENESRPNKIAPHISNISPENGRRINFPQSRGSSLLDKQVASQGLSPNSYKVGSNGQKVNGTIASQPVSVTAKKPPISAFNHVPSKPTLIKSPPVITNHAAAQSPPFPSTKPQPNHIVAQQFAPKPPPSIANPIAQPPTLLSATAPVSRPKPPPAVVNKVAAPPPPTVNKVAAPPLPPPGIVNKVAAPPLPIPNKRPPVAVEPPKKQPHPDTKYLNQILSVPKPDQWCGFDDQEWLFNKKEGPTSKKPQTEELQVQVWSEAKHIESVDVCALPYVIPY